MSSKWDIEGLSGNNLEFWEVKMEAILMEIVKKNFG
ncbi:hypothetical protein A2U01_0112306, partial [Trifolium medium]|nr:hypothetical protein [Trifolium medium]